MRVVRGCTHGLDQSSDNVSLAHAQAATCSSECLLCDKLQLSAFGDFEDEYAATCALSRVLIQIRRANHESLGQSIGSVVQLATHAALNQLISVQRKSVQFLENNLVDQLEV